MEQLLNSFGIDGKILLWQVVNFGTLFLVLWYLLYKPLKKIMKEREERVQESLERADTLEEKSKKMEEEFKHQMTEQREEIEGIHKRAREEGKRLQKELKEHAEKESERILEEARSGAKEERKEILKSAEKEIGKAAALVAGKILEKEIDADKQKELIGEALKSLKQ